MKIKRVVLSVLITVFCITAFIPIGMDANVEHWPGTASEGVYGWTCYCPQFLYYDCGCGYILPI